MKQSCALCLALLALAGCATPTQMMLDAEVKRLCAIDGGIKVYETVKLPAEKFNQWGQVNFYKPTQGENSLGEEYQFKESIQKLHVGDPELLRYHYEVIRRSDLKQLSETTSYQRGGGGLAWPWATFSVYLSRH